MCEFMNELILPEPISRYDRLFPRANQFAGLERKTNKTKRSSRSFSRLHFSEY